MVKIRFKLNETNNFTFASMSVVKLGSIYFIIESRTTIDVHYNLSIASEEIREIKFERIDYI